MTEQIPVALLKEKDRFVGYLLVRKSEQRMGKGGNYLDINLVDRSGEINCKFWDRTASPPPAGSIVKVQGLVETFNQRIQMRIEKIRPVEERDEGFYSLADLMPCAPEQPDDMRAELEQLIDSFADDDFRRLTREMLAMAGEKLSYYPAAQRMHHAVRSGLLYHTLCMARTAEVILTCYPFLNRDLLLSSVVVHDLAKTMEMSSDEQGNVADYTKDGLLLGHLVRGVVMLEKAAQATGVEGEKLELLQHMMIRHHGVPEFGSPRYPMFPEAEVLHMIDNLDAKLDEMHSIVERTPAGAFSEPILSLDKRRIYHHTLQQASASADTDSGVREDNTLGGLST